MSDRRGDLIALVATVLEVPSSSINANSSMDTVAEWDSLAHLNICLLFQERFGVEMDMEMIAAATSVGALEALLP